jgi:hypothetical protein
MPSWTSVTNLVSTIFPGHFDTNDLRPLYERIN